MRRTAAALAAMAVVLCAAAPARATFPGENGEIAYARWDGARQTTSIFARAGRTDRLVARGYSQGAHGPNWSADGLRVAYWGCCGLGHGSVYIAAADGSEVVYGHASGSSPAFAPGGERLAYRFSAPGATSALVTARLDGTDRHTLGNFDDPDWSPDGEVIAAAGSGIFAVPADGSSPRRLTADAGDEEPSWSPDGRQIAFARVTETAEGFRSELFVIDADGSHERILGAGGSPAWSPDGTMIAFSGDGGLWIMDATGANRRLIAPRGGSPSWQAAAVAAPEPQLDLAPECSTVGIRPRTLPRRGDRRFHRVRLVGGEDPDGDPVKLEVSWVGQDEPLGPRSPDARWTKDPAVVRLRDERARRGDGRVYSVDFRLTDQYEAPCTGTLKVGVPRHRGRPAVESGFYASSIRPAEHGATRAFPAPWRVSDAPEPAREPRGNRAPRCASVEARPRVLHPWLFAHAMERVRLMGGSDPDGDPVTVHVRRVGQDEPLRSRGDRTAPDARRTDDPSVVRLRNEWSRAGDGRVYRIGFRVRDPYGARCRGRVEVTVRRGGKRPTVESPFYANSLRR
jgi:hypothetical protein